MKKLILSLIAVSLLSACGPTEVWLEKYSGEAELAKAEFSKKVQIEDARGKYESAKLLGEAEAERAKGVAEANRIIGESLKNNEAYLRWLWIKNLEESSKGNQIIYIPTEAGLPILESSRLKQ